MLPGAFDPAQTQLLLIIDILIYFN